MKKYSILLALIVLAGCSGGSGGASSGANISFELLSTASTTQAPSANLAALGLGKAVAQGEATSAQVTELAYYIYDISICKEMTIDGTGYSGQSGCISVFTGNHDANYDTYLASDAAADTTNYVNLMSATELAGLTKTVYLTDDDIGEYRYGKVDHYRPVKVTASITLNDGTTVYTKGGTSTQTGGSGLDATYVWQQTGSTTAPAAQAIPVLPNGGSWFKFQDPFTIAQTDLDSETTFQMKLAFDPADQLKALEQISSNQVIQDEAAGYGIEVPLMAFTPIIFRAAENGQKESYLLQHVNEDGDAGYASFDFRLDIYAVEGDERTDTIFAADTLRLLTEDADEGTAITQIYRPFSVTSTTATPPVYSFTNYVPYAFLTDFTRGTEVGDRGTANWVLEDGTEIALTTYLNDIETIEPDSTIETISAVDLNGEWVTACTEGDDESWVISTFSFARGTATQAAAIYDDENCTSNILDLETTLSLTLPGKTTDSEGQEVKKIDLTFQAQTMTPVSAAVAGQLNAESYCGYTNWVAGEEKDVLGRGDTCTGSSEGDTEYSIYRTADGEVFIGEESTTEANRPTSLPATATATYTGPVS